MHVNTNRAREGADIPALPEIRKLDTDLAMRFLRAIFRDVDRVRLRLLPQNRDAALAAIPTAKRDAAHEARKDWHNYLPIEATTSNVILTADSFQKDWRGRIPFVERFGHDNRAIYYQVNSADQDLYIEKPNGELVLRRQAGADDITHILAGGFLDFDPDKAWIAAGANEAERSQRVQADKSRLRGIAETLKTWPCPPSYVVHSGSGIQAVWLVEKTPATAENIGLFNQIQANLQATFAGADPGVRDLPRILRLPGTWNAKPGREPKQAQLIYGNLEALRRYSLEALATEPSFVTGVVPTERGRDGREDVEKVRTDRKARGLSATLPTDPAELASEYGIDAKGLRARLDADKTAAGMLWRDGVNEPSFNAKHGPKRGNEFRFRLAARLRAAGYSFAEFAVACLLHPGSHGNNAVDDRQLVRAWAAVEASATDTHGGGDHFDTVEEEDGANEATSDDGLSFDVVPVPVMGAIDASAATGAVVREWMGAILNRARAWRAPDRAHVLYQQPPNMLLRVEAGVGKSAAVKRAIDWAHYEAKRDGFDVKLCVIVPDHRLAEEWRDDLQRLGVKSAVYHGLDKACARSNISIPWLKAKGDLKTLCARCPDRVGCKYLAQSFDGVTVTILTAAALFSRLPELVTGRKGRLAETRLHGPEETFEESEGNWITIADPIDFASDFDAVIVDETMPDRWLHEADVPPIALSSRLADLDWTIGTADISRIDFRKRTAAEADRIVDRVRSAWNAALGLQARREKPAKGKPFGEINRITPVDLAAVSDADWWQLQALLRYLIIKPDAEAARRLHGGGETELFRQAICVQAICAPLNELAAAMLPNERNGHRGLAELGDGGGIKATCVPEIDADFAGWTPKLLLDATAQPEVLERFVGPLSVVEIGARDGMGVNRRHYHMAGGVEALRDGGLEKTKRIVDGTPGLTKGVITSKGNERHFEEHRTLHYGELRGCNTLEDVSELFLVGRHLLPSWELRRLARIIFGAEIEDHPQYWDVPRLVKKPFWIKQDGRMEVVYADAWHHDCYEIDLMIKMTLESEMRQADARARPVRREANDPVVIHHMTGQPVPGLVYDAINAPIGRAGSLTERIQGLARRGFASNSYIGWSQELGVKTESVRLWCRDQIAGGTSGSDFLRTLWEAAKAIEDQFVLRYHRNKAIATVGGAALPIGGMIVDGAAVAGLDVNFPNA